MYKLTILLLCLITYNSQSLTDTYELKFANKNATYTLQIKDGNLALDNQPNVMIIAYGGENEINDTDKATNTTGKTYKITKGATFEQGLKIGASDIVDGGYKIGASDDINGGDREMNSLLVGVHQSYDITLSYALVTVVEKSSNFKREFPIVEDGVYLNIDEDKFSLFR